MTVLIVLSFALAAWLDGPKIFRGAQPREKRLYVIVLMTSLVLCLLYTYKPSLPTPMELLFRLYKDGLHLSYHPF